MDCKEFVESFVESWEKELEKDQDRNHFSVTRDLIVSTVKLARAALEGEQKREVIETQENINLSF